MVSKKIIITDETGLHLRPAGQLCKMACLYKCHITFKAKIVRLMLKVCLAYWERALRKMTK